jgi:hypothetical protein
MHSCRRFPLKQHFEGKPRGRLLYEKLKLAVRKQIGAFKIESLECCIHFVRNFTFLAVKILKNKIRVDFTLSRNIKSKRVTKFLQMSPHRYLLVVDMVDENEIDGELVKWIQEALYKKNSENIADRNVRKKQRSQYGTGKLLPKLQHAIE